MSIFRVYESEEDKTLDILNRECTLALHNADTRFEYESAMLSSVIGMNAFLEGSTNPDMVPIAE